MLWASERTWVPHFVSAGVAMAAAAMIASDPRETPKARAFATWALGAAFVLMGLTSDVSKVLGRFGPEWMKSAGVCVLACAGLMGAVFKSRWAGNARDAEAPAQPPAGVRA
jgi:protein-S-isoprenylcysteine O-methyltransferase Ste14